MWPLGHHATSPNAAIAALMLALLPAASGAGPRIAPVTASCPGERPHRRIDVDGVQDRCSARSAPLCPAGARLRPDASGERDACEPEAGGEASAPTCPSGQELLAAAGPDACEKPGPPRCPSGFKLKAVAGEDQCRR
jgi:hypothetical protein